MTVIEQMAKVAYEVWERNYQTGNDWESLEECDRNNWRKIVRAATAVFSENVRVILGRELS